MIPQLRSGSSWLIASILFLTPLLTPGSVKANYFAKTEGKVLSGKIAATGEFFQEHSARLEIQWDASKGGLANSIFQSMSEANLTFTDQSIDQSIFATIPKVEFSSVYDPATGITFFITTETLQGPVTPAQTSFTAEISQNQVPPVPFPNYGPNDGVVARTHGALQTSSEITVNPQLAVAGPLMVQAGPTPGYGEYPTLIFDCLAVKFVHEYQKDGGPAINLANLTYVSGTAGCLSTYTKEGLVGDVNEMVVNDQIVYNGLFAANNPSIIPITPGKYTFRNYVDAQITKEYIAKVPSPLSILSLPVIFGYSKKLNRFSHILKKSRSPEKVS